MEYLRSTLLGLIKQMFSILANFLVDGGIPISLVLGAIGLVVAILLIRSVVKQSVGTELMQKVAGAIQFGHFGQNV